VQEAADRLAYGEPVTLDASWSTEVDRARARGDDPSEATPEIARRLAADADPWPASRPLDTDRPLHETVADALRLVR
jgi:predicted kinase